MFLREKLNMWCIICRNIFFVIESVQSVWMKFASWSSASTGANCTVAGHVIYSSVDVVYVEI